MKTLRKAALLSIALLTTACSTQQAAVTPTSSTEASASAETYVPPVSSGYDAKKPGRIAYTADGNAHDQDDWAATPGSLSILAAAGLQDALVHYDYNETQQIIQVYSQ